MANGLMVIVTDDEGGTTRYPLKRLCLGEGRALERVTGLDFERAVASDSLNTAQALCWLAMKRQNPALRFEDLDDLLIESIDLQPILDEPVMSDESPLGTETANADTVSPS